MRPMPSSGIPKKGAEQRRKPLGPVRREHHLTCGHSTYEDATLTGIKVPKWWCEVCSEFQAEGRKPAEVKA